MTMLPTIMSFTREHNPIPKINIVAIQMATQEFVTKYKEYHRGMNNQKYSFSRDIR